MLGTVCLAVVVGDFEIVVGSIVTVCLVACVVAVAWAEDCVVFVVILVD